MSMSDSTPCKRSYISSTKPDMTLFTTINVATPSVTLTTDASAMNRVRRYRHANSQMYMSLL
jgi:hypothetical protein